MPSPSQVGPGLPGGFPLPNSGNPGTAYGVQKSLHPAATAARGLSNGGRSPRVGKR